MIQVWMIKWHIPTTKGAVVYQLGNTSSRTITGVKRRWAQLILKWENVQILYEFCYQPEGTYGGASNQSLWPRCERCRAGYCKRLVDLPCPHNSWGTLKDPVPTDKWLYQLNKCCMHGRKRGKVRNQGSARLNLFGHQVILVSFISGCCTRTIADWLYYDLIEEKYLDGWG